MNRPCPNVVTCPGSDDPITNYSSEQTDTLDFVSMFWRGAAFPGALPLGVPWSLNACGAIITGTDTQIETELEAIIAAINCDFQNKYGGAGTVPVTNDDQICCQNIPGSVVKCFTIKAGVLTALNKASANQIAAALACYQVTRSAMGLTDLAAATVCAGADYLDAISAVGAFGNVVFNVIGNTPPGLLFEDIGSGVMTIDGTPDAGSAGDYVFTVTAQDGLGTRVQKTYTITVKDCGYPDITPDVTDGAAMQFADSVPAGNYRIDYIKGAMKFNPAQGWAVNNQFSASAFQVNYTHVVGLTVEFPALHQAFATQGACEAANAGASLTITHDGGVISMFLLDTPDYTDNVGGAPSPTFRLTRL